MNYFAAFLEGIITFVSPCLLPMIPIYISYFAGGGRRDMKRTVLGALGFVLGFTLVFMMLGALAGTAGSLLNVNRRAVDIVCGIAVIIFGLEYLGILKLKIFKGSGKEVNIGKNLFFSSFLFGMVFSISWTPCVGAFLGAALMLASQQGHALKGMLMLLFYSLGLGIPFLLSAVLVDSLKGAFDFIKRHYGVINKICGIILVVIGLLMAMGVMGRVLTLLM